MKKEKLKEYLSPMIEVFPYALEKGFAITGDSDGLGKKEVTDPTKSNVGQFEKGDDWTSGGWNDQTGWN